MRSTPAPSSSARTRTVIGRSLAQVPDGPIHFRHRGVTHHAAVEGHQIVLADGRRFDAPSTAASAPNGGAAINGWQAWIRDGRTIASIVDGSRCYIDLGQLGRASGRERVWQ